MLFRSVEAYFSRLSGIYLSKIFDQYLRTTTIPRLEYKIKGDNLYYRWGNCIPGFEMPVKLDNGGDPKANEWLRPTAEWESVGMTAAMMKKGMVVDKNFYIKVKKIE